MAAIDKTSTTADVVSALDIQMGVNFAQDMDKLMEILGIVSPETVPAGTALYQLKITGALSTEDVAEGDEVPLSQYKVSKVAVGELEIKPYRKMTTAQAILKGGFEAAVMRTDAKMLGHIRNDVMANFFKSMEGGTATSTGTTLQAALANADATLQVKAEDNGDPVGSVVHFVNPLDVAAYIGTAQITTQNAFGLTYLQDFLGIQNVVITSKVEQGKFYATPAENLHIFGADFASLADAGLEYDVQDGALIGVHHAAAYNRTSAETYALSGVKVMAEVLDYICKGTIAPAE